MDNENLKKVNPNDPNTIPKFIDRLPIPHVKTPDAIYKSKEFYEIEMLETLHKFHKFFSPTKVWGYDGMLPGPTLEVMRDQTIYVKWTNKLPQKHFLPVDKTLHGTIDMPEVRTVVHLHGANVDPDSDGHPDAWFVPDYKAIGKTFKRKVYEYTNHQQATTLWYHDHSLGITRLNVYAGLTGFYLIRDNLEERLELPKGKYEIPLLIQDKSFNKDGSLYYPSNTTPPNPIVDPSITLGFSGDTIVVNGKVWPYLRVEPRKYRFRILNGSNSRGYDLKLSNGESFYQIGTDGGLLEESVEISSFKLFPAERIDIVIDFSKLKGKKFTLINTNRDANEHTSQIMEFRVDLPLKQEDKSKVPKTLYTMDHLPEDMATKERTLATSGTLDYYGRFMLLFNNLMWHDPATEKPLLDSIEIWNLVNTGPVVHPVHVHLIQFKILDRIPYNVQKFISSGVLEYTGEAVEPKDFEKGWKDVVQIEPGMVTRIIMHFKDHAGNFVWHCHILEHEDHDMMRPLVVVKE